MELYDSVRRELDGISDKRLATYIIASGILILAIARLISLTNFWWWLQLLLLVAIIAIGVFGAYRYRQWHPRVNASRLPPEPENPPSIGVEPEPSTEQIPSIDRSDENLPVEEQTLIVLKEISARLKAEAEQAREKERREREAAEAKARLLGDTKVYYDEPPGVFYYIKRGLWKTLIAWLATTAIVYAVVAVVQNTQNPMWYFAIIFLVLACVWYTIRCYGDWKWMRRQVIGNFAFVNEPKSGLFALFGGVYYASLLDCDNAVSRKTKMERLLGWPTATVSIDTKRDNSNPQRDDSSPAKAPDRTQDVFNNMENVRHYNKFTELVRKRHDELTFGQPDVIRRNES